MASRTRALWLELGLEAERLATGRVIATPGKALKRDSDRFWARLSDAKRQRFLAAWNGYTQCLEQWKAAREIARAWERAVNGITVHANTNWSDYIQYQQSAADYLRLVLESRISLTEAL